MTKPADIVRRCYEAYAANDRAAIEALIAQDFTFTSPRDNGLDRATYFERCRPNHRWIAGFTFRRMIVVGETVVVTYEASTESGRSFRDTEVLTVRDGRISAVEVYFGWSLPHEAAPGAFVDPGSPAG